MRTRADGPSEPRLTPAAAFLVQLGSDSDLTTRRLRGRIEHVTSGRSDRFGSIDELIAFMAEHAAFEEPDTIP